MYVKMCIYQRNLLTSQKVCTFAGNWWIAKNCIHENNHFYSTYSISILFLIFINVRSGDFVQFVIMYK